LHDTERDVIEGAIKGFISAVDPTKIRDAYAPFKLGSISKVCFVNPTEMRNFVKSKKGLKHSFQGREIWFSVEKSKDERALAKRVSHTVKSIREHMLSRQECTPDDWTTCVIGDWTRCTVHVKTAGGIVMVFHRAQPQDLTLALAPHANRSGLEMDLHQLVVDANSL